MFILIILTSSNEDIIEMVVNGDYHEFEPEKLRGLMKILPEMDEVKLDLNVLMMMILIMFCCIDEYILPEMSMSMICGTVFGRAGMEEMWQCQKKCQKCVSAKKCQKSNQDQDIFHTFLPQGFATHDMF